MWRFGYIAVVRGSGLDWIGRASRMDSTGKDSQVFSGNVREVD